MLRTVKATIDEHGNVKLAEPVALDEKKQALVTILDDEWSQFVADNEAALLAESSLAVDWLRPEEDEAWKHLDELPDLDEVRP